MSDLERHPQIECYVDTHGNDLRLAWHAALPVALTAELLHFLRINFLLEVENPPSYLDESELLLSPLCREIDDGLYEMEPEVRSLLLRQLVRAEGFGLEHLRKVAGLLWQYSDRLMPWAGQPGLERAQELTALSFVDPEQAAVWLARAESEAGGQSVVDRAWFVAMRETVAGAARTVAEGRELEARREAEQEAEKEALWEAAVVAASITEANSAVEILPTFLRSRLSEVLAREISETQEIRTIASKTGLDWSRIDTTASVATVWMSVIWEAERQGIRSLEALQGQILSTRPNLTGLEIVRARQYALRKVIAEPQAPPPKELLTRLRSVLSLLFPRPDEIRLLVEDTELSIARFNLEGSSAQRWAGLMAEVEKHEPRAIRRLFKAALRRYPENPHLLVLRAGIEDLMSELEVAVPSNEPPNLVSRLSDLLAELCNDVGTIRLLIHDAGIDPVGLTLDAATSQIWSDVIATFIRRGMLPRLVQAALDRYPENPRLHELAREVESLSVMNTPPPPLTKRDMVFISYHRRDRKWAEQLKVLLAPVQSIARVWDYSQIPIGGKIESALAEAIERSRAAVVLMSPDYCKSDWVRLIEERKLVNAASNGELLLLTIPIRRSLYQELMPDFKPYQPDYLSHPLSELSRHGQEQAWVQIARDIVKKFPQTISPDTEQGGLKWIPIDRFDFAPLQPAVLEPLPPDGGPPATMEQLKLLRYTFVQLVPRNDEIRIFTHNAGIPWEGVEINRVSEITWYNVIEQARMLGLLRALTREVLESFPRNPTLIRLLREPQRSAPDDQAPSPVRRPPLIEPLAPDGETFECEDFSIDFAERRVRVHGEELHFTRKEFDLLAFFTRHPGRVLEYEVLLEHVWGQRNMLNKETLRVCVVGLRKKIEPDPGAPRYIRTVRWHGYRFEVGPAGRERRPFTNPVLPEPKSVTKA